MYYPILPRYRRTTKVPVENRQVVDEEGQTVTVIPAREVGRYEIVEEPVTYQQGLQVIRDNPDLDSRFHYDAANVVVETYEDRETAEARTFNLFVDIILVVLSLALAGLIIGVMVGQNMLPPEAIPFLLFVALGLVLIIGTIVIVGLFIAATNSPRPAENPLPKKTTVITAQRRYVTFRRPGIR